MNARPQECRRGLLRTALGCALAAAGGFNWSHAQAQASAFPSRPIRFLIPFPPGSTAEASARFIGQEITTITGQPVIVEPRGGGNGFIAVQALLSAPKDGYTLLFCGNSIVATNLALFRQLPYEPLKDLAPVSMVIRAPIVLVAPILGRHANLEEFVAQARREPGKLSIGSGSPGYQLMGALLGERAGVELLHVPYKSATDALKAVVGGEVDLGVCDVASALPLIKAQKVRALASATARRLPAAPDIPTAEEQGLRDFTPATWNCVVAASGVPDPVLDRLASLISRVMASSEAASFFGKQNLEIMPSGREAMRTMQVDEASRWKRIAAVARIEPQ